MKRSHWFTTATVMVILIADAKQAAGQWLERSYVLVPGWNSVYLEVDPEPSAADDLFAGLPIVEVWTPAPPSNQQGPADCQDPNDPSCEPPVDTVWDVWLPPFNPGNVVSDLRLIRGGRVFLIRATAPTTLSLVGRPNAAATRWQEGYNLQGFHVEDDPEMTPTFGTYWAGSSFLPSPTVREVLPDGSHVEIPDPVNTPIRHGTGYWVRSAAASEHDGPVHVDSPTLRGVDFGVALTSHAIELDNRSDTPRTVAVSYVASSAVPPGQPVDAGLAPVRSLEYVSGPAETAVQWTDLSTTTVDLSGAGNAAARGGLRIAINRTGLAPALLDATGSGSQYQGLLVIRDGQGFVRWVPVSGQVRSALSAATAGGVAERPGLYYGQVQVNQVQWVTAGARVWTNEDPNDPTFAEDGRCDGGPLDGQACADDAKCDGGTCRGYCQGGANADSACTVGTECPGGRCSAETDSVSLRPAPAAFTFPVLVHLAGDGTYTMLTEVALLWQAPDDATQTPGRFVLATPSCDPALCGPLEAADTQDGEPFVRRLGTAAFSFAGDLPLLGSFASELGGLYDIAPEDPLNPFRHKFHPDHDCDQLGECIGVTRSFVFNFETIPPTGDSRPGWGDQILGGTYEETIIGLHKESIAVGGRFEISRVSGVDTLNVQ